MTACKVTNRYEESFSRLFLSEFFFNLIILGIKILLKSLGKLVDYGFATYKKMLIAKCSSSSLITVLYFAYHTTMSSNKKIKNNTRFLDPTILKFPTLNPCLVTCRVQNMSWLLNSLIIHVSGNHRSGNNPIGQTRYVTEVIVPILPVVIVLVPLELCRQRKLFAVC